MSRTALKDQNAERQVFVQRGLWAALVVVVTLLVLAGRFAWLQVVRHAEYSARADTNRIKLRALPPPRGLIYDRHGRVLADNQLAYRLELIPEQIEDLPTTLAQLRQIVALSEDEVQRFEADRRARRSFQSVPLKLRLSEDEVARFALQRYRFRGVDVVPYLQRHYPFGALTAHVVGYVGRIAPGDVSAENAQRYAGSTHIGKTGIEAHYEAQLLGEAGVQRVEINAEGRVIAELDRRVPVPGRDLYLSIDIDLQAAATTALGGQNGAVVAIDPRNGEVLALVSWPAFDPNRFVNGIPSREFRALLDSPDRPLFNRALRGGFAPGSTLKPFMALAGLTLGLRTPRDRVLSAGEFRLPGHGQVFRDWRPGGHGWVDLDQAMAQSVNTYFYQLALDLGIDRTAAFLAGFGFGTPTGIDLGGEAAGVLPSRDWKQRRLRQPWYPGETVICGIGQGYHVATPLQLAAATAQLAGFGRRFRPRLLYAVSGPQGIEFEPAVELSAPDPRAIDAYRAVRRSMEAVLHSPSGTARVLGEGSPYRIAGKTGTAQQIRRHEGRAGTEQELPEAFRNNALFIAYAPAADPVIALAVVVERGGGGARAAAPVAKQILDAYLLGRRSSEPPS